MQLSHFFTATKTCPTHNCIEQCFSTAGPRTGTGPRRCFVGPQINQVFL